MTVFRSTDGFIASPDDPRVLYEPGAEALARPVVAALPEAIAEVEAATYGPFVVPIRIYVCGTLDCYRRFTGNDRSGGQTTPRRKIFISPKPENSAARVPFVVAHELTHLHLVQRCSTYRAAQMPSWFNEGFAALVSQGGGAEGVSDADAARAILAGRTFTPTTEHGFSGSHFGLPAHMFYRQAALFIAYLRARDGWRVPSVHSRSRGRNAVRAGVRGSLPFPAHPHLESLCRAAGGRLSRVVHTWGERADSTCPAFFGPAEIWRFAANINGLATMEHHPDLSSLSRCFQYLPGLSRIPFVI